MSVTDLQSLSSLPWEGWWVLVVVLAAAGAMLAERLAPEVAMFCALGVLVWTGVLEPGQAFEGFSEPAVLTIGLLFVCAGALQHTGVLDRLGARWLSGSHAPWQVRLRLLVPTLLLSAFVNNTPIVATAIPLVRSSAQRAGLPASSLLLPLASAAMLGGTCTLVGTSSNLVVATQLERAGTTLGLLELAWIGLPTAGVGLLYLLAVAPRLLPSRAAVPDEPGPPTAVRPCRGAVLSVLALGTLIGGPLLLGTPMVVSALGACVMLLLTRTITVGQARHAVKGSVLVLVGSAFGVARALEQSGAATAVGETLLAWTAPLGPRATLAVLYTLGVVLASFLSNAAAAALLVPIALAAAKTGGHDPRPFAIALAMAASSGFSTPVGCQPNLLVSAAGGYRASDFLKVGLPLNLLVGGLSVVAIPWIWPF